MRRAKLDRIDLRILSDLQTDGRMTNVDLAERAGISAPPCLRRVRARAPSQLSVHGCAKGPPNVRMSSRDNRALRGQVES